MISLQTPVKPLTEAQRERLESFVAEKYLDSLSNIDLERFFLEVQTQYLQDYNDAELLEEVENFVTEDELEEMIAV